MRKEAAEYKAKAEQAEKDAAEQLESYKFNAWFDGLVAQNHGRDGAVIRTLAGTERMGRFAQDARTGTKTARPMFNDLLKNSAYAFEDQAPPPPPYAGGTGTTSFAGDNAAMRSAMGLPAEKK